VTGVQTCALPIFLPIPLGEDKFVIGLVGEKALETQEQNRDNEKFYITGTYINKDFRTGLLVGYYDYRTFTAEAGTASATIDADVAGLPASAATLLGDLQAYSPRSVGQVYYVAPYFSGKIGPITINAEFDYVNGTLDFKPNSSVNNALNTLANSGNPVLAAYADAFRDAYKKDVNMMAYWVEGGYSVNPVTVNLGYTFMSGDKDGTTGDVEAAGFLAPCSDWGKVFILTSGMGIHYVNSSLPYGNITNRGSDMNIAGLSMPYIEGKVAVSDSLTLGALVAYAKADEPPAGVDKDYGIETDLTLSWKFLGNLEYKATAAYLATGDFWKMETANGKVGDMMSFYHQIILTF
jgi:hypothetical protein